MTAQQLLYIQLIINEYLYSDKDIEEFDENIKKLINLSNKLYSNLYKFFNNNIKDTMADYNLLIKKTDKVLIHFSKHEYKGVELKLNFKILTNKITGIYVKNLVDNRENHMLYVLQKSSKGLSRYFDSVYVEIVRSQASDDICISFSFLNINLLKFSPVEKSGENLRTMFAKKLINELKVIPEFISSINKLIKISDSEK